MEYKEINGGKVLMGNNVACNIVGIGSVRIKMWDGSIKTLKEVRHIPDLKRNLISLGMLDLNGCTYKSQGGVLKGIMVVMKGMLHQGLYVLRGTTVSGETAVSTNKKDQTEFWHRRLGHMSLKGLLELGKKGLLNPNKISELDFCETCILGKSHRLKFGKAIHRTKGTLDYIHSDLWRLPQVPLSLSKSQYFISFIDDFSRKVWIYFLKTQDEAFNKFLEWKSLVENQTGKKINRLRTDNGLEFCHREFDDYCAKNGIARQHTCTSTPQQNGLAERMNRTIMNKVRCMLTESGLSKVFWAEAAATACYLINRSPSSAIECKLPEQVWSGTKPRYDHLRPFGCIAYVHVSQGKLNPRAKK